MRLMSLRRLAASSAGVIVVLAIATLPAKTARRPRYGGTLRVEMGAAIPSLDAGAGAATPEVAAAKAEIDSLVYDRPDAGAAEPAGGPFRISAWVPGKSLTLAVNENYPKGRAFVDGIEITMGRGAKERLLDLELGKTDFIEIPADQAKKAADAGVRVSATQPDELLAILFASGDAAPGVGLRRAVGMAADRASVVNFILQKTGEAAGGLLPQWSSGTAFLFSTAADAAGAKKTVEEIRAQNAGSLRVVLGYDSGDSVEQAVAERMVVNAREAGIGMTAAALPAGTAAGSVPAGFDARIVRWRMGAAEPGAALAGFLAAYPGVGASGGEACAGGKATAGAEAIYRCERAIVDAQEMVPVAFVPHVFGLSARVRDWKAPGPGESWPLADVWLEQNP